MVEVKLMSQLLVALRQSALAPLLADSTPDLITLVSSSLKGISEKYGKASQKYISGWKKVTSVLAEIQENFGTEGLFHVLLVDGVAESKGMIRERRAVQPRDYTSSSSHCFASLESCNNATTSCNGQGTCSLIKESGVRSDTHWRLLALFFWSHLNFKMISNAQPSFPSPLRPTSATAASATLTTLEIPASSSTLLPPSTSSSGSP